MSFVSVVDQVKTVPAGTRVGYGGTFVCARTTTLAIVPAGYADGVPRSLSGTRLRADRRGGAVRSRGASRWTSRPWT